MRRDRRDGAAGFSTTESTAARRAIFIPMVATSSRATSRAHCDRRDGRSRSRARRTRSCLRRSESGLGQARLRGTYASGSLLHLAITDADHAVRLHRKAVVISRHDERRAGLSIEPPHQIKAGAGGVMVNAAKVTSTAINKMLARRKAGSSPTISASTRRNHLSFGGHVRQIRCKSRVS